MSLTKSQQIRETIMRKNKRAKLFFNDACNEDNLAQYTRYGAARLSYNATDKAYHFGIFPDGSTADCWIQRIFPVGEKPFLLSFDILFGNVVTGRNFTAGFIDYGTSWSLQHGLFYAEIRNNFLRVRNAIRSVSGSTLTYYTQDMPIPSIEADVWYNMEFIVTHNRGYVFWNKEYIGDLDLKQIVRGTTSGYRRVNLYKATSNTRAKVRNILVKGVDDYGV